jgi:hypothetical protein
MSTLFRPVALPGLRVDSASSPSANYRSRARRGHRARAAYEGRLDKLHVVVDGGRGAGISHTVNVTVAHGLSPFAPRART